MPQALFALALFVAVGCGPARPAAPTRLVRIAAAANLKFAFEDIAVGFRAKNPGTDLRVTYGSSGQFAAQIANKAPFDVFLSADTEYPASLVEWGLARHDDVFRYATGRLVVWVPNGSPLDPAGGLAVVADPRVRKLAIANPRHSPYGRAAEAALRRAGLWEAVQPRLVFGENVEQTAQFVHSGAADAGMLPLSLALSANLRDRGRYWIVPPESHPPLTQAGVILASAEDRATAEALRDFLLGADGQAVLKRHGYDGP